MKLRIIVWIIPLVLFLSFVAFLITCFCNSKRPGVTVLMVFDR